MEDRYVVADLVVERSRGLTVTFEDCYVAEFDLMRLRLWCPCASCRALGERDEDVWPRPGSPTPLSIADAALHGAWGLVITWNDGHSTGIYPFEQLRLWSENPPGRR
ncbi:MAG: DUF971 domain-containing protein [Actinobacteria bacterium]|nr:DUF971 domain-containing protein [Actinomycetota bacterium]